MRLGLSLGYLIPGVTPADHLDGGDLIPGFSYPVADLFAVPAPLPA